MLIHKIINTKLNKKMIKKHKKKLKNLTLMTCFISALN
jgi:hypothetical protein